MGAAAQNANAAASRRGPRGGLLFGKRNCFWCALVPGGAGHAQTAQRREPDEDVRGLRQNQAGPEREQGGVVPAEMDEHGRRPTSAGACLYLTL